MKTEFAKRDTARIDLNYRQTKKAMAYYKSKPSHSKKVMEAGRFRAFINRIVNFFTGLFSRRRGWNGYCVKTPYVYKGPIIPKGSFGQRYGVYMRQRGRKYKKASQRVSA